MTVYKKQLAVATSSVQIRSAGATRQAETAQEIVVQPPQDPDALWTIGEWDGTPSGFLNADKIHDMHPSDARMTRFQPLTFTVGTDTDALFPLALFRGVNDPLTIVFTLTATQALVAHKLRVGVTLAQNNGRTTVRVNNQWTGPEMATVAVKTRGITSGMTTANYTSIVYAYAIPASAFVAGENSITLGIQSGNGDPAEPFLHASVVWDALEFA